MRHSGLLTVVAAACLLALPATAPAQTPYPGYTVTPLSLGGNYSYATAMNSSGQVVGYAFLPGQIPPDGTSHAFLFSGGATIDLGASLTGSSQATAINGAGVVVGIADFYDTIPEQAFFYQNGTFSVVNGNPFLNIGAINASGLAAGDFDFPNSNPYPHAAVYNGTQDVVDLGTLGGGRSSAIAIDNAGIVIGTSDTDYSLTGDPHAFIAKVNPVTGLWVMSDLSPFGCPGAINDTWILGCDATMMHGALYNLATGAIVDLGTITDPTGQGTFPIVGAAMNASAQVAGRDWRAYGTGFPVLYSYNNGSPTVTYLRFCVSVACDGSAKAINSSGQVVGSAGMLYSGPYAFLYSGGQMTDLNTMVDGSLGLSFWSANLINDNGQIVVSASNNQDYLLTPFIPPPPTNVSGQVKVASTGLLRNRATGVFSGTLTVTNTGSTPLSAPLHLVLSGLPSSVNLLNPTGTWKGNPYIDLPVGSDLAPGGSVKVAVQFSNPGLVLVTYTPVTWSGYLQ
jgi:probable HAF family extracellular repeat protein